MNEIKMIYEKLERYFTGFAGFNVIQFNKSIGIEMFDLIISCFFLEFTEHNIKCKVDLFYLDDENVCLSVCSRNNKNEYISILVVFRIKKYQELKLFISHTRTNPNIDYVKGLLELKNPIHVNPRYFSKNINLYSIEVLSEDGLVFGESITKLSIENNPLLLNNLLKDCINMFYMILRK